MDDPFELTGVTVGGRYLVEAAIAQGGFGVVYRARHRTLGSAVAVKVLRLPDAPDRRRRRALMKMFLDEAQIVARLEHPAVVRVLDFGVDEVGGASLPWMAMEWIDGSTLADDLERRRGTGGRSPRACLDLLAPVLEALTVAHRRGIVHRDLKPRNLMLPSAPPELEGRGGRRAAFVPLKVLDFGIAKVMADADVPVTGATQTSGGVPGFSPLHAAPEQVQGARTGPWTDVHAVGLVLTELLTGERVYKGRDLVTLAAQAVATQRPTPARFGVDVGAWEPVLARALALRPADRFRDAGELLAALEAEVPRAVRGAPLAATAPMASPPLSAPPAVEVTAPTLHPATLPARPPDATRRAAWGVGLVAALAVAAATWRVASSYAPGRAVAATAPSTRVIAPAPPASAALVATQNRLAASGPALPQVPPPAKPVPDAEAGRRGPRPPLQAHPRRRRRVTPE